MPDFGTDLSTFQADGSVDIDPLFPGQSGDRVVLEVCARRLMTPSGFFRRYPDFGFDLRTKLGSRINAVTKLQLQAQIEAELVKDERVLSARVTDFTEESKGIWKIRISVKLASGPFTLVLRASSVTVEILETSKG